MTKELIGKPNTTNKAVLGWVEEMDGGSTNWLRLRPATVEGGDFVDAPKGELFASGLTHMRLEATGLQVRRAGQSNLGEQRAGW